MLVAAAGGDLRSWFGNLVDVSAPLGVWTAAVLVPVALYLLALSVFQLFGGGFGRANVLPAAAGPAVVFATFIRGGLEEPGWRGLHSRFSSDPLARSGRASPSGLSGHSGTCRCS